MKRSDYIDNLKGHLMILVVWGHVIDMITPSSSDDSHLTNGLLTATWNVLFAFHMPAFALVSGAVAKYPTDTKRAHKELMSRIWQYLVIGLTFRACVISLHYMGTLYHFDSYHTLFDFRFFLVQPFWHEWYLMSLFFWNASLIYVVSLRHRYFWVILAGLLFPLYAFDSRMLSLNRTVRLFPFFLVGYEMTRSGCFSQLSTSYSGKGDEEHGVSGQYQSLMQPDDNTNEPTSAAQWFEWLRNSDCIRVLCGLSFIVCFGIGYLLYVFDQNTTILICATSAQNAPYFTRGNVTAHYSLREAFLASVIGYSFSFLLTFCFLIVVRSTPSVIGLVGKYSLIVYAWHLEFIAVFTAIFGVAWIGGRWGDPAIEPSTSAKLLAWLGTFGLSLIIVMILTWEPLRIRPFSKWLLQDDVLLFLIKRTSAPDR